MLKMKQYFVKLSVAAFILIIVIIGCKKMSDTKENDIPAKFSLEEKGMIIAFLESKEFKNVEKSTSADSKLNLVKSFFTYVDDSKNKPVINLLFEKEGKIVNLVEVIPIPKKVTNVLPNNERYAMQLSDFSSYNIQNKSGVMVIKDLNFENFIVAKISLTLGQNTSIETFPISQQIISKYSYLKRKSDIESQISSTEISNMKKNHFCDKNGNGNVSFGECTSCMLSACYSTTDCSVMCTLVSIASGGTRVGGQCHISVAAACVYLSIVY